MAPERESHAAPSASIRVWRFLRSLRTYWWLPLLTVILAAGAFALYLRQVAPTFVSRASMWETEKLRLPEGAAFTGDALMYRSTQTELLRNEAIKRRALARLLSSSAAGKAFTIPKDSAGQPISPSIDVAQVPKTTIFSISATAPDPIYAKEYLDVLLKEYLEYKRNVRKEVSGDTLASISEQVQRLERDLKTDQDALSAFQRTNNLAILEEEARVAGGYLARLDTQLSDYRLDLKMLDATVGEHGTNQLAAGLMSASSSDIAGNVAASPEYQAAARNLELLRIQRQNVGYLSPKNPEIVKLDEEIERAQKAINAKTREQLAVLRQTLLLKINNAEETVKEWRSKATTANAVIGQAERLKLNVDRSEVLYNRLVSLLQNVDISRNIDQETFSILENASDAGRSYQNEKKAGCGMLLGGLFAGFGIVLLISWRDDRFGSLSEVTDCFGDGVVGQVPEMQKLKGQETMTLIQVEDDRQIYTESYRALRSALIFMSEEAERPQTVLITSAMPHEGKSTIAANLARTLALGGARVLLIDADLRRGYLHDIMGLNREPGFSDLLANPESLDGVVQTNCLPNLSFIARGKSVINPADLFLSPSLDSLLHRLRSEYNFILIDSSPVFAADDAGTLAPKMDGTLFVVRNRLSRAGSVQEALEILNQRRAKILGLVVNGADASSRSYRYYKYSEYHKTSA